MEHLFGRQSWGLLAILFLSGSRVDTAERPMSGDLGCLVASHSSLPELLRQLYEEMGPS